MCIRRATFMMGTLGANGQQSRTECAVSARASPALPRACHQVAGVPHSPPPSTACGDGHTWRARWRGERAEAARRGPSARGAGDARAVRADSQAAGGRVWWAGVLTCGRDCSARSSGRSARNRVPSLGSWRWYDRCGHTILRPRMRRMPRYLTFGLGWSWVTSGGHRVGLGRVG